VIAGDPVAGAPSWFACRLLKFSYVPVHTIVLLVYHFQRVQPIYTLSKSPYMYKTCQSTQVVSNTKWNKLTKMFTQ